MKKFFKQNLAICWVFIFALFLRTFLLDAVPPSMYWDEVSQGYNAYSILNTGKDEHQEMLPIARFKAFGDYKAPIYTYLIVPFIAILGKSALAVRLPSALLGSLTILLTYFLVREIFFYRLDKRLLAICASFLLAISPWHIQLSRAAYEGNVATFFTVLGALLFFLGIYRNGRLLAPSIVSFVIAFYAFNAHRVFIPLFVCTLFLIYARELLQKKRAIIIAILMGIVLLIPFLFYLQSPESRLRFNEVNIFSDLSVIRHSNELIQEENTLLSKILHNRRVLFGLSYIQHYFDFFNPTYLFFSGDGNPRFSSRDNGQLYLWELPFLLIGFYLLLRQKKKAAWVLILWFFLSPVAGATARETPHALRSEMFLPIYQIIGALGIIWCIALLRKTQKIVRYISASVLLSVVSISFIIFLHDYFVHFPVTFSYEWQYGYKQAVQEAEKMKDRYDIIAFTEGYGRPYIYVLFFSNIKPQDYWQSGEVVRDSFGFYSVPKIGKYEFRKTLVDEEKDRGKKVLYVGKKDDIHSYMKVKKTINFLNGNPAFILAEN